MWWWRLVGMCGSADGSCEWVVRVQDWAEECGRALHEAHSSQVRDEWGHPDLCGYGLLS